MAEDLNKLLAELPPRPQPPIPGECCGRGCENCVWIYYERALARWERAVADIDPELLTTLSKGL
jgi:hypothetical protein